MKTLTVFAGLVALASAPVMAQTPQVAQGKKLFQQKCAVCHVLPDAAAQAARVGPSLQGVVGRKAGTSPTFPRYSAAMKKHGAVWTEANLDKYLDNPRAVVKGTTMAFVGLKQPAERAAVIAYLKSTGKK